MAGLETETVHYCYKINGQVKIYDLGFYISRIASGFWIHVALSLILFFFFSRLGSQDATSGCSSSATAARCPAAARSNAWSRRRRTRASGPSRPRNVTPRTFPASPAPRSPASAGSSSYPRSTSSFSTRRLASPVRLRFLSCPSGVFQSQNLHRRDYSETSIYNFSGDENFSTLLWNERYIEGVLHGSLSIDYRCDDEKKNSWVGATCRYRCVAEDSRIP